MNKSSELIDQIYENHDDKANAKVIDEPICDICKNRQKCPESAKKLATQRDNECVNSC